VTVALDGVRCEGAVEQVGRERRAEAEYATILLAYDCPGSPSGAYEVRYGVFSEADAVVDDHTNVTDYQLGDARGVFVFDAGHRELDAGAAGPLSSASRFAVMGVEHILAGLDHVLFLVALLLGAQGFGSVLKLASTFTAAHSLTLALAALGWVRVPAEVVEPLIALSIAYVAAENIIGGESRHRLAVVFGFGLLHGLGFASTLSITDDVSGRLLASLVTFNVGIELGQALIIAALFPLLLLIRRHRWSAAAHAGAAVIAVTFGLTWFFDRLLA
jgi:HupE / UreJ protein